MKGIIKGSLFSLALITVIIVISSIVAINVPTSDLLFKNIFRILTGFCIFAGCFPVSRSAENNKLVRGIISALISLFVIFIVISIICGKAPLTSGFLIFTVISFLFAIIGSAVGALR